MLNLFRDAGSSSPKLVLVMKPALVFYRPSGLFLFHHPLIVLGNKNSKMVDASAVGEMLNSGVRID
jgi:hypothetical protein